MPFIVLKQGCPASRPWGVFTETAHGSGKPTGDPHGCHATEEEANAQLRALYHAVPEARKEGELSFERKSWESSATVEDADAGLVHAVVSVFEKADTEADIVHRGAFSQAISEGKQRNRLPPGVWSHDWRTPVAKTLDAFEDDEGLHVLGQFNLETQAGRETFSNIKHGIIDQYSFGFIPIKPERKEGIRHIRDLRWFEWSPVLYGMNPGTYTHSVKRLLGDGMALEEFLSALGDEAQEGLRRVEARREVRTKEGRRLSLATLERLGGIAGRLEATAAGLRAVCQEGTADPTEARDLWLKFVQSQVTGDDSP